MPADGRPDLKPIAIDSSKQEMTDRFNGLLSTVQRMAEHGEKFDVEKVAGDIRGIQDQMRAHDERRVGEAATAITGSERDLSQFVRDGSVVLRMMQADSSGKPIKVSGEEGVKRGFTEVPGLLDPGVPICGEWHREFRELMGARSLARVMLPTEKGIQIAQTPLLDSMVSAHIAKAPESIKRIFSGGSGSGSDWQQTDVMPDIMTNLLMPVQPVEDLFDVVPMKRKSLIMPFATAMPFGYRYGTPSGNNPNYFTASDIPTSNRTMTADGIAVAVQVFEDAEEDSLPDVAPIFNAMVTAAARHNWVMAMINGDTNGQDTLTGWNPRSMFDANATFGGSDDPRKSCIGIRAYAFDASATRDATADTVFTTQTLK